MNRHHNTNPHQYLYRRLFIAALVINVPSLMALAYGEQLIFTYLGLVQFMTSVIALFFFFKGKKELRGIHEMMNGAPLLHWTYEKKEQATFTSAEYRRQKKNAISTMLAFFAAGPLVASIGYKEMTFQEGLVLGLSLGVFSYGFGTIYARSIVMRTEYMSPEAIVGPSSVLVNGLFIDWNDSGTTFLSAAISNDDESGASSILIRYTLRGRYGVQEKELFIPIPNGKTEEASDAVVKLNSLRKGT